MKLRKKILMSLGIVGLASATIVPIVIMSSCSSTNSTKVILSCLGWNQPNFVTSYTIFETNGVPETLVRLEQNNGNRYQLTLNDLKTMSNLESQNKNVFYFNTREQSKLTLSEYMEINYGYFFQ